MDPAVEERIRARAYLIWEEEGRPVGHDVEHWIRAVLELSREGVVHLLPDGVPQLDIPGNGAGGGREAPRGGS